MFVWKIEILNIMEDSEPEEEIVDDGENGATDGDSDSELDEIYEWLKYSKLESLIPKFKGI